jgi:hypothetical protein
MSTAFRALSCLLILGWITAAAEGAWDVAAWRPWPFHKDDKPGKPDKIVALWTDTVLTQANQPPRRGFGGRLMFYEGKKEDPIKVEGRLIVYAFDETGRDPNNARPDHKYVFTAEQLPAHYSKSKIGHSYSVWLPWDEVGGMQKEITLIVRFEPKTGPVAVGEQCRQLLPGVLPQQRAANGAVLYSPANVRPPTTAGSVIPAGWGSPPAPNGPAPAGMGSVQPTSYEAPASAPSGSGPDPCEDGRPRRMMTATIAIPPGMASRPVVTPGPAAAPAGNWQPPAPWTNPREPKGLPPGLQTPPQATSPTWPNSPPRVGFAPARLRGLGEPLARLNRDRVPWQLPPAGSPSALGSPPGPEYANGAPASRPTAASASN